MVESEAGWDERNVRKGNLFEGCDERNSRVENDGGEKKGWLYRRSQMPRLCVKIMVRLMHIVIQHITNVR